MKTRFSTYDLICSIAELQGIVGMRVNQVYDIDQKTYLIKLNRGEEKVTMMMESGSRIHTTVYDWPKNNSPSSFSMKLRKHLKNKRLEAITQVGVDRIVDLQFGTGDVAYHVLLEMFDKGNIILTDKDHMTLNLLRPHTEHDTYKFAVREKYPLDRAKQSAEPPTADQLLELFHNSKKGDNLKKLLNPRLEFGPAIIEHCLLEVGLSGNLQISTEPSEKYFNPYKDLDTLLKALAIADQMFKDAKSVSSKGYIIQKREERPPALDKPKEAQYLVTNQEFHPFLYKQHHNVPYAEYESFDRAIDDFFSKMEGQKADLKIVHMEREAAKKLSNVERDHTKRVSELEVAQNSNINKAELITRNQDHVDKVILALNVAIASQTSWSDIESWVSEAKSNGDPIAKTIHSIKFKTNHVSLLLNDPYHSDGSEHSVLKPTMIDVDLNLSAHANARRYYDQKKAAAKKQQKTIEAQSKARESAEKKTMQTRKEAQTIGTIRKARKIYWFEKFFWFISSDNYLVIGGRDRQQNEILVKRYLRSTDIYVHADIIGASSVIIKNPTQSSVPARTLDEAGLMAVTYSGMWETQIPSASWWVLGSQVSKTPPAGQYLTAGSFMIRGKKNYLLPPARLALGFSFMFRLDDDSISRHIGERRSNTADSIYTSSEVSDAKNGDTNDQDIHISESEGSGDETEKHQLKPVMEEDIVEESDKEANNQEEKPCNGELETPTDNNVVNMGDSEGELENMTRDMENVNTDSDNEEKGLYPETHVKVEHDTGKVIVTRTNSVPIDNSFVIDGLVPNDKVSSRRTSRSDKGTNGQGDSGDKKKVTVEQPKRGHRSKLKKIKDKYKDQDEEDRAHMMLFLQSGGSGKPSKKAQKKSSKEIQQQKSGKRQGAAHQPQPVILHIEDEAISEDDEQDENEQQSALADVEMLNQLTGCPLPEDELLFAVPVVAPYSALINYKFKVKMITGGSKRGKAARTALQLFLKDKNAAARERDLLKAVKDEDLARNFPGKVKLSMPAKR